MWIYSASPTGFLFSQLLLRSALLKELVYLLMPLVCHLQCCLAAIIGQRRIGVTLKQQCDRLRMA
jgi:hypothetical protein